MANGYYNRTGYYFQRGELALQSNTLKTLLLRSTGSYSFNPDHDYVADLFSNGGVELSVASYARQTITTPVITLDDSNNWSKFTADNISFGALESGQTVVAIVVYKFVTNDADSILLSYHDGKTNVIIAAPVAAPLTGTITGATQANPCVITSAAHGLSNGDKVKIASVGGMTELNGNVYTVANKTTNNFQLSGINSSGYGAYTSGGSWKQVVRAYVRRLKDSLVDGSAVNFSGVTGTVVGTPGSSSLYLDIADASGAISAGASGECQTPVILPAALGGGNFQFTIPADGLYRQIGGNSA